MMRLILSLLLLSALSSVYADPQVQLVVTHPSNDYQPTFSSSTEQLVFVSERGGFPGLYQKQLGRVDFNPEQALYPYPGRTLQPAFSPDGNFLAFYSQRFDALGDVLYVKSGGTTPRVVPVETSVDKDPWFHSDNRTLFFSSSALGKRSEPKAFDVQSQSFTEVVPDEYYLQNYPRFPIQSIDSSRTAALLYSDDTNMNGQLGEGDRASVWLLKGDKWFQSSFPLQESNGIAHDQSSGRVYIGVNLKGNLDIGYIDLTHILRSDISASELLSLATEELDSIDPDPDRAIVLLRAAWMKADTLQLRQEAGLNYLRTLNLYERHWQAWKEASYLIARADFQPLPLEFRVELFVGELAITQDADIRFSIERELEYLLNQLETEERYASVAQATLALARSYARNDNPAKALESTAEVLRKHQEHLSPIIKAEILLFRSNLFLERGLGTESRETLLKVFDEDIDNQALLDDISRRIIRIERSLHSTLDELLFSFRSIYNRPNLNPILKNQLRLEEAKLLFEQGQTTEPIDILREVAEDYETTPLPSLEAALILGDRLENEKAYRSAVEIYGRIVREIPVGQSTLLDRLRATAFNRLVKYYLVRARRELLLGDPLIAASTCDTVLEISPEEVGAWRLKVQAQSDRIEFLQRWEKQLKKSIRDEPSALQFYKLALVQSYIKPDSRDAEKSVLRAITLKSDVPHFYLLLGFLLEQRFREEQSRGNTEWKTMEEASVAYEQASLLSIDDRDPLIRADALLNRGNASLLLQQYANAFRSYTERSRMDIPFPDPRTEFLFYRNSGIAGYRSLHPNSSILSFQTARKLLVPLEEKDYMDSQSIQDLRNELIGREALSLMDLGKDEEAAALFGELSARETQGSLNAIRAQRNEAISLFISAKNKTNPESYDIQNEVLRITESALTNLEGIEVTEIKKRRVGALFNMDIAFEGDAVEGGALIDLDLEDERRLLLGIRSQVLRDLGLFDQAIETLEAQVRSTRANSSLKLPYRKSVLVLSQDQLASLYQERGDFDSAWVISIAGVKDTRFLVDSQEYINIEALTRLLAKCAELAVQKPELLVADEENELRWLYGSSFSELPLPATRFLIESVRRVMEMKDPLLPEGDEGLVRNEIQEARLLYALSLALNNELRSLTEPDSNDTGMTLIRSAQRRVSLASELAKTTETLEEKWRSSDTPHQIGSLYFLTAGFTIQSLALSGLPQEADNLLDASLAKASENGYTEYRWYLLGQRAVASHHHNQSKVTLAEKALEEALDYSKPWSTNFADRIPFQFLSDLEIACFDSIIQDADPQAIWNLKEKWIDLYQRYTSENLSLSPSFSEESEWTLGFLKKRDNFRELLLTLRRTPFARIDVRARLRGNLEVLSRELAEHLEEGKSTEFSSATFYAPNAEGYEIIDLLLEPPFPLNKEPVFVATIPGKKNDSFLILDSTSDRIVENLNSISDDQQVYILGQAPEEMSTAISLIDGESLFRRYYSLNINKDEFAVSLAPGTTTLDSETLRELAITSGVNDVIFESISSLNPGNWRLSTPELSLSGLLNSAPLSRSFTFRTSSTSVSVFDENLYENSLNLAVYLEAKNIDSFEMNGNRWLSHELTPENNPELAKEQIQETQQRILEAYNRDDLSSSIHWLQRTIYLKNSIQMKEGLAEDYRTLAILNSNIARWNAAYNAAKEFEGALDKLDEEQALFIARLAVRADKIEDANERYLSLIKNADPAPSLLYMKELAIFLENSQLFPDAYRLGEDIISLAEKESEEDLLFEQYIRSSRILRIYLNRYTDARRYLNEALNLAEKNNSVKEIFEAQINLARLDLNQGFFEDAKERLEQLESTDDPRELSQVLLEQANLSWYQGDYQKAFMASQEAKAIAENVDSEGLRIAIGNVEGLISWSLNDIPTALRELKQALEYAVDAKLPGEIASTNNNIGLVYRTTDAYEEALNWFRRALQSDISSSNRWGESYSSRNLGITYQLMGEYGTALDYLNEALSLSQEIGDPVNETKALLALGDTYYEIEDFQQAKSFYTNALNKSEELLLREVTWRAMHGLARLSSVENETAQSIQQYKETVKFIDSMRASIRVEEFQNGFLVDKQQVYDELIALQISEGTHLDAFRTSESARGRNFIDLLGNRSFLPARPVDQDLIERERKLRSELEKAQRALIEARQSNQSNIQDLENSVNNLESVYTNHLILMRENAPQLSSFVSVQPATIEEIRSLLDNETALVVYHLLESGPVSWVLTRDQITFHDLRLTTRDEVADSVSRLRIGIQNIENVDPVITELSDVLWRPLEARLSNIRNVGIVPHQALHTLPFATIRNADERYLIDRFALFYSPSASLLRYTIKAPEERSALQRVLAIGNPYIGSEAYNLPFAEKEAERLQFSFDEITILKQEEATESWFISNADQYGVIHIAGHGEYLKDLPMSSFLYLAADEQNDGKLTASEIFQLEIKADLVALSACQSGLGEISAGDEIIGLNRAFVYAGTSQLISTLWRVDDVATALLFKYFYRSPDDMQRAEAVRQAQLTLKARPQYSHPVYWAGITLTGDWK